MPANYDPTTEAGRVRLLISDVGGTSGTDFVFQDNEVDEFLGMEGGSVKRAAAMALRTMAGNEAMVSKRIKFLELSTDGPAVADSLLKLAVSLEERALVEEGDDEDADPEIAEMAVGFNVGRVGRGPELSE